MSVMSSQKVFQLVGGDFMPLIGYGTFRVRGRSLILEVLDYALAAGYRLIDTAVVYGNEEDIGEALSTLLPKYNLTRQDLFITSKLPPNLYGDVKNILEVVQNSLVKLKTNYLDLYLIHWPGQQGRSPQQEDNSLIRDQTWQALVETKNRGWVKNIGVSNYTVQHLTELLQNYHGVLPAVNQVEWHPLYHQPELLQLCHDNSIILQAYCSLGGTSDSHVLLNDPSVQRVSKNLYKSPAQVLLAWALQQGVAIIPKSLRKEHIIANINLDFKIPEQDLVILNNLTQRKFAWDPTIMFADQIVKLSLDAYNCLKKTGKPTENEWTVLSTIVLEKTDELCVIALGTGTKCIGKSQMSSDGVILNDSHAEVVCRRAFIKYLYNEMLDSKCDIIAQIENEKFRLAQGVKFHLFSSLMPCGDASIFPKSENDHGYVINRKEHSFPVQDDNEDKLEPDSKKVKLDFHRTGAKCLASDTNIAKKDFDGEYHITGAVRTKPGRGDPTVSASCSDKIAKWIQVGIQGSLLSVLLEEPIYLSSITIGHEVYCKDALERALYKRFVSFEDDSNQQQFKQHIPELFHCSSFKFSAQKCTEKQPAPSSIIYVKHSKVEVAVDGFKQGVTKKNKYTSSGRLQICKLELYRSFLKVSLKLNKKLDCNQTYGALKHSTKYSKYWNNVREKTFRVWPMKDSNLEEFVTNVR